MNGIAAIALGSYLALVGLAGNRDKFLLEIQKESGFLHWGVSIIVLLWLRRVAGWSKMVDGLIFLALVALLLNPKAGKIFTNLNWFVSPKP